eukprot:scaffold108414_cov18-Prasinocladus_malaysianus.AAC.1
MAISVSQAWTVHQNCVHRGWDLNLYLGQHAPARASAADLGCGEVACVYQKQHGNVFEAARLPDAQLAQVGLVTGMDLQQALMHEDFLGRLVDTLIAVVTRKIAAKISGCEPIALKSVKK